MSGSARQQRGSIDAVDRAVVGTRWLSPISDASVGSQSTAVTISSVTAPVGTWPGQRTIPGARMRAEPGPNWPRHGPLERPIDCARPAGLSLVHDDRVVGDVGLVDGVEHLAGAVIELGEGVGVDAARSASESGWQMSGGCIWVKQT